MSEPSNAEELKPDCPADALASAVAVADASSAAAVSGSTFAAASASDSVTDAVFSVAMADAFVLADSAMGEMDSDAWAPRGLRSGRRVAGVIERVTSLPLATADAYDCRAGAGGSDNSSATTGVGHLLSPLHLSDVLKREAVFAHECSDLKARAQLFPLQQIPLGVRAGALLRMERCHFREMRR